MPTPDRSAVPPDVIEDLEKSMWPEVSDAFSQDPPIKADHLPELVDHLEEPAVTLGRVWKGHLDQLTPLPERSDVVGPRSFF